MVKLVDRPMVLDGLTLEAIRNLILRREEGWSLRRLVTFTKNTYGIGVSQVTMDNFLKRRQKTISGLVYGSPEFKNKVAEEYVRIIFDFRKLADELIDEFKLTRKGIDITARNRTDRLCLIISTFFGIYDRMERTMLAGEQVPELDINIPQTIDRMKKEGVISVRSVIPPEEV